MGRIKVNTRHTKTRMFHFVKTKTPIRWPAINASLPLRPFHHHTNSSSILHTHTRTSDNVKGQQHLHLRKAGVRMSSKMAATREVISTDTAPGAVGPYSQAIKTNGFLYVSGRIPLIPGTMDFSGDGIEIQTEQVFKNMGEVLKAGGCDFSSVVKTTVLLADMGDFKAMNGVYAKYFTEDPPARSAFAVKDLPLGAKVEIECIAACD